VRALNLLDTPPEDRFDRIVRLAQRLFDVPMVAVNLIDDDRQYSKARVGLEDSVTPRSESFCSRTIESPEQLVVTDTLTDARFAEHPAVTGAPGVRFYAGQPLSAGGHNVGALCLVDSQPRELSETERRMLRDLGTWVENELNLDQELVQAREVQRRLLPRRAPDVPTLDVAGRCVPASDVGGDFYDWQVSNGQLQVMVADVMGKGITAAIVAAGVRAVMRGTSRYNDLRSSLQRTAVSMQEDLDEVSTFVTMFVVRVDPATGHLEYVDAGHGLALILSPDGASRQLRTPGLPIGAVPGDSWESGTDVLAEGETLLLVSDGVLDAFPNVTRAVEAAEYIAEEGLSAAALVDRVIALFSRQSQPDDVTVVAVVRNSTG
jgi:hypothetical protein